MTKEEAIEHYLSTKQNFYIEKVLAFNKNT